MEHYTKLVGLLEGWLNTDMIWVGRGQWHQAMPDPGIFMSGAQRWHLKDRDEAQTVWLLPEKWKETRGGRSSTAAESCGERPSATSAGAWDGKWWWLLCQEALALLLLLSLSAHPQPHFSCLLCWEGQQGWGHLLRNSFGGRWPARQAPWHTATAVKCVKWVLERYGRRLVLDKESNIKWRSHPSHPDLCGAQKSISMLDVQWEWASGGFFGFIIL